MSLIIQHYMSPQKKINVKLKNILIFLVFLEDLEKTSLLFGMGNK